MRLLLANPNTTQAVTDMVARRARAVAPDLEIRAATSRFGAAVIGTRAELAIAEHAALDLLAREAPGADAAIIAASTDSGLRAARALLSMPVLGLTESALHVACLVAPRFATVTLSAASAAMLHELIALYGLGGRCAGEFFADATPRDMLADPQAVLALVGAQVARAARAGAECVALIGAVMAEAPEALQAASPVALVEGVSCAVALARALCALPAPRPFAAIAGPRDRATTGLDPALAGLMLRGSVP